MRLISQDGMIDVPYEQAIIEYEACERNGEEVFHIIFARTTRNAFSIARYSTESKALKVMEMLRCAYTDFVIVKSCLVSMEDLQPTFLKIVSEKIPKALVPYFRFPTDEEVEV